MSDQGSPRRNGDPLASFEGFAAGVGRLGFGLLSLPLNLLPPQSRRHMYNAIRELSYGFARLPRDFADIAGAEVERWADEGDARPAPAAAAPAAPADITLGGPVDFASLAPAPPEPVLDLASLAPAPPLASLEESLRAPAGTVGITYIEFDPPGSDLEGEYVRIRNGSDEVIDLTGWRLTDGDAKHSFVFPVFALAPGAEVQLWTKSGSADATNLYWGGRRPIWNNTGDTGTLRDSEGAIVSVYTYGGKA